MNNRAHDSKMQKSEGLGRKTRGQGVLMALLLLLLGTGCGHVEEVYLAPPEVLTWGGMQGLDHVAVTEEAPQIVGKRIEVDLLDPRLTLAEDSEGLRDADWDWEKWHDMIEAATADALYQTRIFNDVAARSDPGPMEDPDLVLIVALTEWEPGNRWLRYFFGFGLGRTRMQTEAKLRVVKTGSLPFTLADAREHPGGPSSFPIGFKALKTEALLKEDYNQFLVDLQEALCEGAQVPFKPLDRSERHLKYHPRLAPTQPIR